MLFKRRISVLGIGLIFLIIIFIGGGLAWAEPSRIETEMFMKSAISCMEKIYYGEEIDGERRFLPSDEAQEMYEKAGGYWWKVGESYEELWQVTFDSMDLEWSALGYGNAADCFKIIHQLEKAQTAHEKSGALSWRLARYYEESGELYGALGSYSVAAQNYYSAGHKETANLLYQECEKIAKILFPENS